MNARRLVRRFARLSPRSLGATVIAGIILTLLVMLADSWGALAGLERWLYDQRVARCQFFTPPPTDRLVHLDIDDAALESIGRWPWDRSILAQVLDEVGHARPKAVCLDIVFSEPQDVSYFPAPAGTLTRIDHDAALASSLAAIGTGVVPASFKFPRDAPLARFADVREELIADLDQDPDQVAAALASKLKMPWDRALQQHVSAAYITARASAMHERVRQLLSAEPRLDERALRARLLPRLSAMSEGPLTRLLAVAVPRVRAELALQRLALPRRSASAENVDLLQVHMSLPPIPPLAQAAVATGFVDFSPSVDGRVRSLPLFVRAQDRIYPQMGLALACLTMGVPLTDVTLDAEGVTLPRPGQSPLFIPTRTLAPRELDQIREPIPAAIDLPFFGDSDWETMYRRSGTAAAAATNAPQHLPITEVWDVCATERRIVQNNRQAFDAVRRIYGALEAARSKELAWHESHPIDPDDWKAHIERAQTVMKEVESDIDFYRSDFNASDPGTITALAATQPTADQINVRNVAAAIDAFDALGTFISQTPELAAQLDANRAKLRQKLEGKTIIVGWTASSAIADFVSTPLHARCPGPVLHGLVFNAIMTGEVWRRLPGWMTLITTLAAGLMTTSAVALLTPARALLVSAAVFVAYALLNGVALFDWGNIILGAAGPLAVVAVVWAGGTLTQLVLERRQRALIRRRFRTYVDPRLVEYVERNPMKAAFDGERREMTVVFTDIIGFTKLTESLGEETVGLLNELWTRVVPIIRRDGYLNKFLGDGVMFFYGAPEPSNAHASQAVRAALELNVLMRQFNEDTTKPRGLPTLGMRVGVSTGPMIVGDAGAGAAASDYTVLGDNVNLGSRLEGASKYFGTHNLMTARTAELAIDDFLFRPIADLRVVGKQQGVPTVEALCALAEATDEDRECAARTNAMVRAYRDCDLEACIRAADALEQLSGSTTLAKCYRDLATGRLSTTPCEPFDPAITLESK